MWYFDTVMLNPSTPEKEIAYARGAGPDDEALLFNAGVRALGGFGFSDFEFEIGGKKSRRRHVKATSPEGDNYSIWIKSTLFWIGLADVLRFPWSKRAIQGDDLTATLFAADDASRRGCSHLMAIVGDAFSAKLWVAQLYTVEQLKTIAIEQKNVCHHPFFTGHGAALIIRSHNVAFDEAEAVARTVGVDVLTPAVSAPTSGPLFRARSGRTYARNANVRSAVLKIAGGRCERCGQQGFLTSSGEYYLETHHVVEVSKQGPDTIDNVVAVCPNCHRQAHFAAHRVVVEHEFMEAIRRRKSNNLKPST